MKKVKIIQSLERASRIIDCFNSHKPRLKLADISQALDLNINTTRGLVNTLVYLGYLHQDPDNGDYFLGYRFVPKAQHVEEQLLYHIQPLVKPFLKDMAEKYCVTTRMQMVSSGNLFTIYTEVPSNARYLLMTRAGIAFPLHATSSGKAYLAHLPQVTQENYLKEINYIKYTPNTLASPQELRAEIKEILKQGYALELDEIDEGIASMAFPLLNHHKTCYGTLSFTAPTEEILDYKEAINKDVRLFLQGVEKEFKDQA
ncbi:MAG: IclR family transcriptional regulator [Tissierellia bacterium]|nr:IclR family transcriptional regulator [Tissierellia bacterium]